MKVLHVTLDGYHPENEFSIFSEDKIDKLFEHKQQYTSQDKTRRQLVSHAMWMRIYSSMEPIESVQRFNPEKEGSGIQVHTKYSFVPAEQWLWNKIAKKGVKTFVYPYYLYYHLRHRNFLTDDPETNENLYAVLRRYNYPYYSLIEKGVEGNVYSDWSYHGFHTQYDNAFKDEPEIYDKYYHMWKRNDPEELEEMMPGFVDLVKKHVDPKVYPQAEDNRNIQKNEIYPIIQKTLDADDGSGAYVHVGLCESDPLYHFNYPFPDLMMKMRDEYFDVIIEELIEMVDPDILIIHGDHGMKDTFDDLPRRAKTYFTYEGREYRTIKATWSITPIYLDHTNTVGGIVWTKDGYEGILPILEEVNNSPRDDEKPRLFMDTLYEVLTSIDYSRDNLNELED